MCIYIYILYICMFYTYISPFFPGPPSGYVLRAGKKLVGDSSCYPIRHSMLYAHPRTTLRFCTVISGSHAPQTLLACYDHSCPYRGSSPLGPSLTLSPNIQARKPNPRTGARSLPNLDMRHGLKSLSGEIWIMYRLLLNSY